MFQVRRILVATDFSPCARLALDHAGELARRLGAEIHLLHVIPLSEQYMPFPDMLPFAQAWFDSAREKAREHLAQEAKLVSGPVVRTEVRDGSPHECILAAAADAQADMIVIGTHGRTGLSHVLIGSVAERVVRHSPQPVLTVRLAERTAR